MEYLNYAQTVILNVNPNFEHDLYNTYQRDIRNYRCEFTRDELDYLATAPEITVTCDPSNAPIEGYNEIHRPLPALLRMFSILSASIPACISGI